MPRPAKPPRLWLHARAGRASEWVILDRGRQHRTGCGAGDRAGAEQALAAYIQGKYRPEAKGGRLADLRINDVMLIYLQERTPSVANPQFLAHTARPIIEWWGLRTLADIRGATCREYVAWRTAQTARGSTRRISDQTARHELKTLRAAIGHYHREHGPLDAVPAVTLPEMAGGKDRWLTRSEAARLLWAARHNRRLRRFLLLGLYTGTRRDAILRLQWGPSLMSGYIDLEAGVLHRKGGRERATKKRRPSCRIPEALLPHLRRWHAYDAAKGWRHVCHHKGGEAVSINGERMAGAALLARLNAEFAKYGVGRGLYTGDTTIGLKGRIIFEAPGLIALLTAHRALEETVLTKQQNRFKPEVARKWVELVYEGFYHDPLKYDLEAFLASSQGKVNGEVTLETHGARVDAVAVSSPHILNAKGAVYAQSADWGVEEAEGFIKLFGMSSTLWAEVNK